MTDRERNSRSENISPQDDDRPLHDQTTTEVFQTVPSILVHCKALDLRPAPFFKLIIILVNFSKIFIIHFNLYNEYIFLKNLLIIIGCDIQLAGLQFSKTVECRV